ncbi:hypothetical protein [Lyngbya sp. CCAP 1446/10]|nr:hypothetical protein [Lyngbya sp. CCAP 1446/10]
MGWRQNLSFNLKEEGRRKREEGRRKREEGRRKRDYVTQFSTFLL